MRTASVTLVVVLALLVGPTAARGDDVAEVRGRIEANARWSGTVRLTGDLVIGPEARLDIDRGTRIVIAANADPRGGWNEQLVEIHVEGRVVADGTLDDPIVFVPQVWQEKPPQYRPDPSEQPWLGMIVRSTDRAGSIFRGCVFRGGLAALQVGGPNVKATDCVFEGCSTGVQTGVLWASQRRELVDTAPFAPRLERCRFGGCFVGVTVEGRGRPEIDRCLFVGCDIGAGNRREGITSWVAGLGPFVDRSLFLRCGVGLTGPSRVMNSMFVGNRIALLASAFQRLYSATTDRVVRSHNLYHGNEKLTVGDTPIGEAALLEDPRFVRTPPAEASVEVLRGRLATMFALRPESPALGTAVDGGDLGPSGGVGSLAPWELMPSAGDAFVFDRWLVAGPPAADEPPISPRSVRRLLLRPPRAGQALGDLQWGVLDAPRRGVSPPLAILAPARRLALAYCRGSGAAPGVLLLGYDGVARGWWNGVPLELPAGRRRYDPDDIRRPVQVERGLNVLLLEIEPGGSRPRLSGRLAATRAAQRAPRGVGAADGAYRYARSTKIGTLAVEKAIARRSPQTRGSGAWTLQLRLSERIHWLTSLASEELVALVATSSGREVSLKGSEARFNAATRFLRVSGLDLRRDVGYEVRLKAATAPDGGALDVDRDAVPVAFR